MPDIVFHFFAVLTIGSAMYQLRQKLLGPGPGGHDRNHPDDQARQLSPTEVAYLTKEGDAGFALIVILFDILHREMKDKIIGGEIEKFDNSQRSYEVALKKAAGGSLKAWSMRKFEAVTDIAREKDPIKIATKLPAAYRLIRTGVDASVRDLFRDPRNIKKFITVPGLMKLAADIGATGYRVTLAEELKQQLTDDGFLATDETRHKTVQLMLATFVMSQIGLLSCLLIAEPSPWRGFLIYISGLFAAFGVAACTGAREFIPLYSDLARALAQVKGDNIRITIVRTALKTVTIFLNMLSVIVFLVLSAVSAFLLYSSHTVTSIATYFMLVGQMLVQLIAFSYLVEAFKLHVGEMPTGRAKRSLAALQHIYQQDETLPALKTMLSESNYSPELSYLIALYGLETLFLI
jgi:hypothetical protein